MNQPAVAKTSMPILFLRGLGRTQRHWGPFKDLALHKLGTERCLFLDTPGNGELFQTKSSWSIKSQVEFLRAQKEFKYPIQIVSISLGSMIALKWAELHPNEIADLVCINTSAANLSSPLERIRLPTLLKLLGPHKNLKERERTILQATTKLISNFDSLLPQWQEIQEKTPTTFFNLFRQIMAASRFQAHKNQKTRYLFLNSLQDELVFPVCSEKLAKAFQSELKTHPTAGHDLPLDAPEWVLEQVIEFLR